MWVSPSWFVEPVTVESYQGEGAYGPSHATIVTVLGNVVSERVLARNASGDEVVAEQIIKVPAHASVAGSHGRTVDSLALLAPESKVTVYGRKSRVLTVKPHTIRGRVVYVEATTT